MTKTVIQVTGSDAITIGQRKAQSKGGSWLQAVCLQFGLSDDKTTRSELLLFGQYPDRGTSNRQETVFGLLIGLAVGVVAVRVDDDQFKRMIGLLQRDGNVFRCLMFNPEDGRQLRLVPALPGTPQRGGLHWEGVPEYSNRTSGTLDIDFNRWDVMAHWLETWLPR